MRPSLWALCFFFRGLSYFLYAQWRSNLGTRAHANGSLELQFGLAESCSRCLRLSISEDEGGRVVRIHPIGPPGLGRGSLTTRSTTKPAVDRAKIHVGPLRPIFMIRRPRAAGNVCQAQSAPATASPQIASFECKAELKKATGQLLRFRMVDKATGASHGKCVCPCPRGSGP